jgi:hypothetical protein
MANRESTKGASIYEITYLSLIVCTINVWSNIPMIPTPPYHTKPDN